MKEIEYPSYTVGPVANISWGAIFAGVFVIIATMATLSMLGAGIGLASAPAAESGAGLARGLGMGAMVWLFLSGIVSFYAGGWITGRMTRAGIVSESVVHSVVTWALATTAFAFLLTSAVGGVLGGAAGLMGSTAKAVASGGTAYASNSPQSPQQLSEQAKNELNRLGQQVENNMPSRGDMAQKAETAAQMAGAMGIGGFFMLVLEALACAVGGRFGTRLLKPRSIKPVQSRETAPF